jgi:hypothetical protein
MDFETFSGWYHIFFFAGNFELKSVRERTLSDGSKTVKIKAQFERLIEVSNYVK